MRAPKLIGLFFFLSLIAFAPLLDSPFLYDDVVVIENNELLGNFSGIDKIWSGWVDHKGEMNGVYRPAFLTTLSLLKTLFGNHALWYRLFSLLLHSINAFLLYQLGRHCFRMDQKWAFLSSILFLVHPMQATNFALVWKQSDLWFTFFFLSSTWFWFRSAEKKSDSLLYLGLLCFPLGLLFKESLLVLPGAWFILEPFLESQGRKKRVLFTLSALVGSFTYFYTFRTWLPPTSPGEYNPATSSQYLATQAFEVFPSYLINIIIPTRISFDRAIPQIGGDFVTSPLFLIFLLGTIACTLLYFILIRKNRFSAFLTLGLLTLVPTSSVVPLALIYDETRMYLFVGFFFLALASCVEQTSLLVRLQTKVQVFALSLLLLSFLLFNWMSTQRFASEEELWTSVLQNDPKNPRAHYQIGQLLDQEKAWNDAETHYRLALKYSPRLYSARFNLGLLLGRKGQLDEAREEFTKLLKGPPSWKIQGTYSLFLDAVYRGNRSLAKRRLEELEILDRSDSKSSKARSIFRENFAEPESGP